MHDNDIQKIIASGKTALGIELGSTRIKAVLIGEDHSPLASGSHEWENKYENGIWTYPLEDIWAGLQDSFRQFSHEVEEKYQISLDVVGALGFSGMMHGYMAFDKDGNKVEIDMAAVNAWVNPNAYKSKRQAEYPPIGDQLDALWKGGDAATEMLAKVQAVKTKYPKGVS